MHIKSKYFNSIVYLQYKRICLYHFTIRFMLVRCIFLILLFVAFHNEVYAQHKPSIRHKRSIKKSKHRDYLQGTASYYSNKFIGKKTASGELFDQNSYTAACNVLPFGTDVIVKNMTNNLKVKVKINDRLAKNSSRLIDLSKIAAKKIGLISKGITKVKLEIVKK